MFNHLFVAVTNIFKEKDIQEKRIWLKVKKNGGKWMINKVKRLKSWYINQETLK